MSTKTSIKRIALVAVSALGFGLMSVVPASASTWDDDDFLQCTTATISTDEGYCVSALNSQVKLKNRYMDFGADGWDNTANAGYAAAYLAESKTYYISVTGATIQDVLVGGVSLVANTATDLNGTVGDMTVAYGFAADVDGYIEITTDATAAADIAANQLEIRLTSAVASDATVRMFTYAASGARSTVEVSTLSFAASGSAFGISATNSSMGIVDDGTCVATATPSAGKKLLVDNELTADYYLAGVRADLCIQTFNGNGEVITPASVVVVSTKGWVSTSDANTGSAASATIAAPGAGFSVSGLKGDSLQKGVANLTAIVTDALGNSISLSATFNWHDALASLTLANTYYASAHSAGNTADAIVIIAKDASGTVIPYGSWADTSTAGSVTTLITQGSTADLIIASDNGSADAGTTFGSNNAYATVALGAADALVSTSYGSIDVNCLDASYETISITLRGYDVVASTAAGVTTYLRSNTVKFDCSETTAAATGGVVVTPAATSIVAGESTTVNVTVKTASGRLIPDGTTVTLAASNGASVAPNSKTTLGGTFAVPATLVTANNAKNTTVTAIVGSRSGSAVVALTGSTVDSTTAAVEAAADAAAEAIDAANAATDAANLAAEAADAATVAAEEARDAADAATAAVEELATQVATLMAALKAQITTLANTVAKIAKKVKA